MSESKQRWQWPSLTAGACYYPEHWDESLWGSDLERMLKAGIKVIRIAEFAWSLTEPEEGVFRYDFFDRFLDLCQKKGMKVIFGTPTATPPAWLTKKYPEVLNADQYGIPYAHGSRRHYNYNSPVYRKKVKIIVTALARHYGSHPAVCGWQIDNEMNCHLSDFYSEADRKAFREFLKKKYGSLEALNKAWGTVFWNETYTDWEEIDLPGHVIDHGENPHQRLDYIRFVSDSVVSFSALQYKILKQYKKPEDFVTTNGLFPHIDNTELEQESLDLFGYDSYPNFAFGLNREEILKEHGFGTDGDLNDRMSSKSLSEVRALCPHFMILEQQTGAGSWVSAMEGPMPLPGQIRLWALQSIAHGADFVSFFRWRTCAFGTEMYWHGILDYDNRDNRRLAEIKRFTEDLEKLAPLCGSEYTAPVAILKDFDNMADSEADSWHGALSYPDEEAIYREAQLAHIPCDFVFVRDNTTAEELSRYKVVFDPHPAIVTKARKALLEEYVKQGGTLVLGCRSGYKQENGQAVMMPSPGLLSGLCGCSVRESSFRHPAADTALVRWGEEVFPAPVFHELLDCEDRGAEVLARYENSWFADTPALVRHRYGKGSCLYWGSTFTAELLKKLFGYTGTDGIYDDLLEAPESVEITERRKDGRRFIILLNYLPQKETIVLRRKAYDLLHHKEAENELVLEPFDAAVLEITAE